MKRLNALTHICPVLKYASSMAYYVSDSFSFKFHILFICIRIFWINYNFILFSQNHSLMTQSMILWWTWRQSSMKYSINVDGKMSKLTVQNSSCLYSLIEAIASLSTLSIQMHFLPMSKFRPFVSHNYNRN